LPPDKTILAFDTSAAHCAAALLLGGRIVASRYEPMMRGQAERLMPMLDEILGEIGTDWEQIDAIGVGVGPGNFTGIRIGVSAARGLALALGVPAIGASAFELVRDAAPEWDGPELISIATPRRDVDVVLQRYAGGEPEGRPFELRVSGDHDVPELAKDSRILGHESAALNRIFCETHGFSVPHNTPEAALPAEAVVRVAAKRLTGTGSFLAPSPLYVRAADAAPASEPPPVLLP